MSLHLSIRIPRPDQQRYLRGGCFVFASELRKHVRRETGFMLELQALWVDGRPEHVFLVDPETCHAYDARGSLPLTVEAISKGALYEGHGHLAPITPDQIREWAISMDPHNARIDIARHVVVSEDEDEA